MSPKVPRVTCIEVLRALRRAGWQELRQSGSHVHLTHPDRPGSLVTVAMHGSRPVPVGTLSAISRSTGLSADDLRKLL